jgi:hypothetical protein
MSILHGNSGRAPSTGRRQAAEAAGLIGAEALECIVEGRLLGMLEDWSPSFLGYHIYFRSRRQSSPALALVVGALRYRG